MSTECRSPGNRFFQHNNSPETVENNLFQNSDVESKTDKSESYLGYLQDLARASWSPRF